MTTQEHKDNTSDRDVVDVAILGGGISGLTAALALKQRGHRVALLEASDAPGGCIRTWSQDGFLFELGPNTVIDNAPQVAELCRAADVEADRLIAQPAAKKRFVVKRGGLVPLPGGPIGFLKTPLFSLRAKLRLLREPFIGRPADGVEESIAQFARRRLGAEFLDYAVGPFVSGVYAGDPEKLSVQHATAKIYALEEKHGSLIRGAFAKRKGPAPGGKLFSFARGLDALPLAIASALGESWCPDTRVESIARGGETFDVIATNGATAQPRRARAVVVAIPATAASAALRDLDEDGADAIADLPYADVAVVSLGYRRADVAHPLDGFGFLAPSVETRHVLGCLFPSSLFPDRAPADHVALSAFVGGACHPDRVTASEDEVLAATLRDLTPLLGLRGDPALSRVERWRPAIPQYNVGHGARKLAAEQLEGRQPGLFLSGNLLYGVSVADCIRNAWTLAERVDAFLGGGN